MLQQLAPNGITEKATPARRTPFWPAVPMRLADLRIPKSVVMDLILRHLHMDHDDMDGHALPRAAD